MDGLLVETEELWSEAKVDLFARYGETFSDDDRLAVLGTSESYTSRYLARRFGRPETDAPGIRDEYLDLVRTLFRRGVKTREGAVELVRALRGAVPLGLASNTRRELVDIALAAAGLTGSFDVLVTADVVEHGKPAPDIYLEACRRLGVEPSEAIALEDSGPGIAAAKAAGLTCIAVPTDAAVDPSAADVVIASLLELLDDPLTA
jgi:HAD superfamily hydrolase (TIGR01509 family)